ncbi:MAG: periplasmic heavy metal sensor [Acidobacteria bacterium]|nr:periplasmic heavy metal sensor [Acidobacteriota bacterium]
MARQFAWAVAALLAIPAFSSPAVACVHGITAYEQPPQKSGDRRPPRWWADEPERTELGITDQQSAAIEQIWQNAFPRLKELRERLDQLEDTLSQMIRDAADEATIMAHVDKVESTRTEANKSRVLMLYRMNRVLTPEQRVKLKALRDRRESSRRGPGPSDRRH